MKRFALLLLLLPTLALAQTPQSLNPGTYRVKSCQPPATAENCRTFIPECVRASAETCTEFITAESCAPLCPVVEQTPCLAATVLPQPVLLIDPVGDAGIDPDNPAPHLVGPAVQKKKLKPWAKIAINFGIGVLVGAVAQHQMEDDEDGGDTNKTVVIYPTPESCEAHGDGHGTDCDHED
jgi:hypothetical protein